MEDKIPDWWYELCKEINNDMYLFRKSIGGCLGGSMQRVPDDLVSSEQIEHYHNMSEERRKFWETHFRLKKLNIEYWG